MRMLKFPMIVVCAAVFLTGCGKEDMPESLIQRPVRLLKAVGQCQVARNPSTERAAYCKMVLQTISSFMAVVAQQQLAPEEFGLRVLKAEMNYAVLSVELAQAKATLSSLNVEQASKSQVAKATKMLASLELKRQKLQHEIVMMLAAIGMISPE